MWYKTNEMGNTKFVVVAAVAVAAAGGGLRRTKVASNSRLRAAVAVADVVIG